MTTHRHFKLFKPFGFVSQFVSKEKKQHKKKYLGALFPFPEGVMSIGRLDEKSEGLLLLTTDGMESHALRSKKIEKEYYVQVDGNITQVALSEMAKGVEIGFHGKKYITLPCKTMRLKVEPEFPARAKKIRDDRHGPTSWVSIIITEGKYRQVRKMTAAVGFPTLRLVRVRVGDEMLDKMTSGECIEVQKFNYSN